MSLVNDMLRDLENRRGDAPAVEITWMKNQDVANRSSKRLMILSGIVLVIAAVFLYTMRGQILSVLTSTASPTSISTPVLPENPMAEQKLPAKPVVEQPQLKTQLEDVTQETTDGGFVLRLQFNAAMTYTTESKSNFLRLRFAGVQQSGNFSLPDIPAEFAILQLLDEGDALVLTLQTRSAVSYQLRRVDPQTLVISLSGLPINPAIANESTLQPVAAATDGALTPAETTSEKMPVAMNDVVDVKKERQLTPAQRDKQIALQAKNVLRNGNRQQARQDLTAYVTQYPQYARDSGFLLASLMLENREYNAAIYLLKTLRKTMPEDVPLRQLLAQALITNDQLPQALQLLKEMSPPVNVYTGYYEVLGAAAQKSGDTLLASRAYQALLTMDPARGDWLIGYAIALDASNQKDRATQIFAQALTDKQLAPALRQYARQRLGLSTGQ